MTNRAIYVTSLLLIVLIGFAVRLHHLDRPLKVDEATNYLRFATQPVSFIISDYSDANNHVLHTLITKGLLEIGGNQPMVFRLSAFIAGILIIPATALLALRIYNRHASILAAAFVAASGALIDFSTNNRGYTMVTLFTVVLFVLAYHLKRHNDYRMWAAFALLAALGFYTMPLMVFPMGGIALWLTLSIWIETSGIERRRLLRNCVLSLLAAAALTVVLYSPILADEGFRVINGEGGYTEASMTTWYGLLLRMPRRNLTFFYQGMPAWFRYATILLPALGFVMHWRLSKDRVPLVIPALLWVYVIMIAMWFVPGRRTWLIFIPVFYVVMAAGASWLLLRLRVKFALTAAAALLLTLVISLRLFDSAILLENSQLTDPDDVEQVALDVGSLMQEGDQMLYAAYSYTPLFYYLDKHDIPNHVLVEAAPGEVDFDSEGHIYALVYPEPETADQWLRERFNLDPAALELRPIASYLAWDLVEIVPREQNP